MWKESWIITKNELMILWQSFLGTLLATILIGMMSASLLEQMVPVLTDEEHLYSSIPLDILFLFLTPCYSTIFLSSPYLSFKTIKEDPFGKRMALYRAMPVSTSILAGSRLLLMIVTFVALSITYYISITFSLSDSFYQLVTMETYIPFIVFWLGYSLLIGSLNVYIEYGTNGKILYIFSFLYGLVMVTVIIIFWTIWNSGMVEAVLKMVNQTGWLSAVLMLILGIISFICWGMLLKKRLNNRDYL
ncbi:hypothetical protein SAMN04487944_10971 [Gracilibacillus ureilyticus]|uniref:ABC-2 family transporter protein n=1 Tax=Gracilibacillus ureilyticus TaxID=531814 RepID=A0A1H9RNT8_9BACI|nr:hypothetical protein [Gracilibacillus ureilyticus]SER74165.1 hypothetical protein SAMN04487944_10971 [Gracilibacillus ureilyticus]